MLDDLAAKIKQQLPLCGRNATVELIYREFHSLTQRCPGMALPPVAKTATKIGVARQTMQKVYDQLEAAHRIVRMPGGRVWHVRDVKNINRPALALILPERFADYHLSQEFGPHRSGIYAGLIDRAMEAGMIVVPIQLPAPEASKEEKMKLIEDLTRHYEGVIHLGDRIPGPDPVLEAICSQTGLPQVAIDCLFPQYPNIRSVVFDGNLAGRLANVHLRDYGHRRIALVYFESVKRNYRICVYQLADATSFQEAFLAGGNGFDAIFKIGFRGQQSDQLFERELFQMMEQKEPPTAFWCRTDVAALELMNLLLRRGYRIPEDVSVIGFDDLPLAKLSNPPLSTIRCPRYELGYRAVSTLAEMIDGQFLSPSQITIPPVFYARKSTGSRRDTLDRFHTEIPDIAANNV